MVGLIWSSFEIAIPFSLRVDILDGFFLAFRDTSRVFLASGVFREKQPLVVRICETGSFLAWN